MFSGAFAMVPRDAPFERVELLEAPLAQQCGVDIAADAPRAIHEHLCVLLISGREGVELEGG